MINQKKVSKYNELLDMVNNPLTIKKNGVKATLNGHSFAVFRINKIVVDEANKVVDEVNRVNAINSAINRNSVYIKDLFYNYTNLENFLNDGLQSLENTCRVMCHERIIEAIAPILSRENDKIKAEFEAVRADVMENGV